MERYAGFSLGSLILFLKRDLEWVFFNKIFYSVEDCSENLYQWDPNNLYRFTKKQIQFWWMKDEAETLTK